MNRTVALASMAALRATLLLLASAGTAQAGDSGPPDAAASLTEARSLFLAAKYAEAEHLLRKSAATQKKAAPMSAEYAATLDLLGVLHTTLANYARADDYFREAAAIFKQRRGESVRYAVTLTHRAKALTLRAHYNEAGPLIGESLAVLAKGKLEKSVEYAKVLVVLADLQWAQGKKPEAHNTYSRAIELFKAKASDQSAECATAQNNLGLLDRSDKSEDLIRAAMDTRKALVGEHHPDYANSLTSLAIVLQSPGKLTEVEALLDRALEIRKQTLGEGHPDYASTVNTLANYYRRRGDSIRAEPEARRAMEICERVLGPKHPYYASALNNLALVSLEEANYGDAVHAFTKVIGIYDATLAPDHPYHSTVRKNLAELYEAEGFYPQAKRLLDQVGKVRRRSADRDPHGYAQWLVDTARLERMRQQFEKAKTVLRQASDWLKKKGNHELDRAVVLEELGMLDFEMANSARDIATKNEGYRSADAELKEVLDIRLRHLGAKDLAYATALENQARLYQALNRFSAARVRYQTVLEIRQNALGEQHPACATTLETIAALSQAAGKHTDAEALYRGTAKLRKESQGVSHPEYAAALANLADSCRALEKTAEAAAYYKQSLSIVNKHLIANAVSQSEQQQLTMMQNARQYLDKYCSLTIGLPAPRDELYAEVLAWKGAVSRRQQTLRKMRRAVEDENPEIAALYRELDAASRQLAQLSHAAPRKGDEAAHGRELDQLDDKRDRLELELAAKSADFRRDVESRSRTPEDIRQALPGNVALVDLLEYRHYPKLGQSQPPASPARRLIAFVVRRDAPTELIELGPAETIEEAVKKWRDELLNGVEAPDKKDPAARLRQLVWTPLEQHVSQADTVLVSPDGASAWMPWAALPAKESGKFLIESQSFVMLPVPQMLPDMLASDATSSGGSATLLVVGDIDYGAAPGIANVSTPKRTALRAPGDAPWQRLAATNAEMTQVAGSFGDAYPDASSVTALRGPSATEEAVRAGAPEHRFLHFATHGFFRPPQVASAARGLSSAKLAPGERAARSEMAAYHPGILSGIVLAGANRAGTLEEHDGILTALEVEQLGLAGVELVTLSACQTGIGNTVSGEGLLGLQRAFQVAGARSVLATLWTVDDAPTARLMAAFYDNLWRKKLSRAEALRQAQLDLLNEENLPGKRRGMEFSTPRQDKNRRPSPYFWAAFVLSGDWR